MARPLRFPFLLPAPVSERQITEMQPLIDQIRMFKNDLVPRYGSKMKRPLKIILGADEFRRRRALAKGVSPEECHSLGAMESQGYLSIQPDPEALAVLCRAANEKFAAANEVAPKGAKTFFSQLLKKEDLDVDGVFVRFALDEKILKTAAAYFGCAPFLESIELLHSKPVDTVSRSQMWHKDRTDKSLFKIFVYCKDVAQENGPFSFLTASESDRVPENLPHYLSDAEMSRYVPLDRTVRITGEAGTTFLIDTSRCYHFGSRCAKPRLAYVAYFTSGFGYFPRETEWDIDQGRAQGLSALQRFALGAR
jgi:hypothetical protein